MTYTTIKIPVESHRLMAVLAEKSKKTKQDVLFLSLKDFEKKLFWEQCSARYAQLATEEERNDNEQLYENTLLDGLEDEY